MSPALLADYHPECPSLSHYGSSIICSGQGTGQSYTRCPGEKKPLLLMAVRCPLISISLCLIPLLTMMLVVVTAAETAESSREIQRVSEKELLLELQDVLYKLQSKRGSAWEGKYIQVPKCMMGEACAVKRGARIGKLCDCPLRSSCSYFFLRCL